MKIKNIVLFTLLGFSAASTAFSERGKREVLLDNDKVQVVRLTYPPGTESGMHTHVHPHRTVYVVKGGTLELVSENKQSKVLSVAAGKTLYLPAMTHNVKNIGDSEVVLIENEIK